MTTLFKRVFLMSSFVFMLLATPVYGSDNPRTVHEGEALRVRAACDDLKSMDRFVLMLNDGSTIEDVRMFLWVVCPVFPTIQNAVITEVLQVLDAHQRRWFIVRLFVLEKGREYYSFWSTSLDQRDA